MGTSKVITAFFSVILIFIVTVGIVNFFIPLSKKIAVDNLCDTYYSEMDTNGGLTDAQVSELRAKLINAGVDNITISAPRIGTVRKGEYLTLTVRSEVEVFYLGWLTITKSILPVNYTREVLNRKIVQ